MKIYLPYKHKDGEELRFALRSIDKHFPHDVVLVTDKVPEWYKGDILFHKDISDRKQLNIISKLFEVKDESFFMWNDDHFLLKPITEIKNWYEGTLSEALKKAQGSYYQAVRNTIEHFGDCKYYDIHVPVILTKRAIQAVFGMEWGLNEYVIKTSCLNSEEGEEMKDLKIYRPISKEAIEHLTKDRIFFSTGATGFKQQMKEFLTEKFPYKSRWERFS